MSYPLIALCSWSTCIRIMFMQSPLALCSAAELQCGGHSPKYRTTGVYGEITCQPCSKCPPGTYVSRECTEDSDTECASCPEETYSKSWSRSTTCQPCRICSPHLETLRACTAEQNTKCAERCDPGYYMESLVDECYPCSLCFNDSRGYSPPRIQECVEQGMPANMQCRPSRSGTSLVNGYADIVTGDMMTEENGAYRESVGIQQVVLQSNLSLTSTRVSSKSNNHVSITVSALIAAAVVVVVFAVVIRFGCKRNRHYRSLTSDQNILDDTVTFDHGIKQSNNVWGYYSPLEEYGIAFSIDHESPSSTKSRTELIQE